MPELALICWALYGIGALGIRVVIHQRRTGSSGLIGSRAAPGSLEWVAEMAHILALGLGLAAPILDLLGVVDPIGALNKTGVHVAGIALFAVGLAGVIAGQAAMGDTWRIGTDPNERTMLVTDGLFSLVRNPIYTALIVTLLGLALMVPSVVALASVAIFVAAVEIEMRAIEEPHLRRVHGTDYEAYAARVGRLVPGLGLIGRR